MPKTTVYQHFSIIATLFEDMRIIFANKDFSYGKKQEKQLCHH